MPKKLSDIQRILIANAAKRPSLRLLPPPKSLAKNAGTIAVSIKSMLGSGLVDKVPAEAGDIVWPGTNGDDPVTLVVTATGLTAIGIEASEDVVEQPKKNATKGTSPTLPDYTPRAGTKLATLIEMLSRKDGATLAEIATITNWQHHSIRGAISGALKKKLALIVTSDVVEDRGRVYRIARVEKPASRKAKRPGAKSAARKNALS